MMKRTSSYLVAAFAMFLCVGLVSCEKDEDEDEENEESCETVDPGPQGTLRLQFSANVGGNSFALFQPFTNVLDYQVQVEQVKFYISDIRSVDGTTESQIKDVALLDWEEGVTHVDIPMNVGDYDGLNFGMGVPSTLNVDQDPSVYDNAHPLSIFNQMHWSWSAGYIFAKFEGRADTTATGSGALDRTFVFHTGADTLYRNKTFDNIPFSIAENQTTTFELDMDVSRFFYNMNDTIDLRSDYTTHTSNNLPLAIRFVDLFMNAITHP